MLGSSTVRQTGHLRSQRQKLAELGDFDGVLGQFRTSHILPTGEELTIYVCLPVIYDQYHNRGDYDRIYGLRSDALVIQSMRL